jgi:hypothetical protein
MSESKVFCGCGAEIESVTPERKSEVFWRRVGTGEVCANNHWHIPATVPAVEGEPKRPKAIGADIGCISDDHRTNASVYLKHDADSYMDHLESQQAQYARLAAILGCPNEPVAMQDAVAELMSAGRDVLLFLADARTRGYSLGGVRSAPELILDAALGGKS